MIRKQHDVLLVKDNAIELGAALRHAQDGAAQFCRIRHKRHQGITGSWRICTSYSGRYRAIPSHCFCYFFPSPARRFPNGSTRRAGETPHSTSSWMKWLEPIRRFCQSLPQQRRTRPSTAHSQVCLWRPCELVCPPQRFAQTHLIRLPVPSSFTPFVIRPAQRPSDLSFPAFPPSIHNVWIRNVRLCTGNIAWKQFPKHACI